MMYMEDTTIRELDTVALTIDVPADGLIRGSVGTVVQRYSAHEFEVEFVDNDGRTYALATLKDDQLLRLNFDPIAAA
jgi:hypothetical protein